MSPELAFETSKKNRPAVIYSVQYLRFIAAALVVLVHSFEAIPAIGTGTFGNHFNLGAAGVDIFFVISGFIMCVITQNREVTARNFLLHRLVRVAPPYWAITALMAGLVYFAPNLFNSSQFVIPHVIASFLFIGWPHPVMGDAMPIYFPGWTLQYEAFFYIIFAAFLRHSLLKKISFVSAVIFLLVMTGLLFQPENEILKFYTKPIMVEFIFGMVIGTLFINEKITRNGLNTALVLVSAALFIIGAYYWPVSRLAEERFIFWGIPAAMLVMGLVFMEARGRFLKSDFLRLLGDASYSTYLVHFFVIGAMEKILHFLHPAKFGNDLLIILPCFIASWTAGVVFHLIFEKPAVIFIRKRMFKND